MAQLLSPPVPLALDPLVDAPWTRTPTFTPLLEDRCGPWRYQSGRPARLVCLRDAAAATATPLRAAALHSRPPALRAHRPHPPPARCCRILAAASSTEHGYRPPSAPPVVQPSRCPYAALFVSPTLLGIYQRQHFHPAAKLGFKQGLARLAGAGA